MGAHDGAILLVALLALAGALPTAGAQVPLDPVWVEIVPGTPMDRDGNGLLGPDVDLMEIPLAVWVHVPPGHACTALNSMEYDAALPGLYATAILHPPGDGFVYQNNSLPYSSGSGGAYELATTLFLSVDRSAPALRQDEYVVRGHLSVEGNSCTWGPTDAWATVPVRNDYFPILQAIPERTVAKVSQGARAVFPVDLVNHGNGMTEVAPAAFAASHAVAQMVLLPAPVVLDGRPTEGPRAEYRRIVNVEFQAPDSPGYSNRVLDFKVRFTGSYAGPETANGSLATYETIVSLRVQIQGVSTPGLDTPVLLVGVLLLAGLLRGRFDRP